ncbi:uncharacterized protein AB9W97_009118 isoform 1-T1 [Spinachia spinachia]
MKTLTLAALLWATMALTSAAERHLVKRSYIPTAEKHCVDLGGHLVYLHNHLDYYHILPVTLIQHVREGLMHKRRTNGPGAMGLVSTPRSGDGALESRTTLGATGNAFNS